MNNKPNFFKDILPHIVLYAIGGLFGIMAVYNAGKIDHNLQLKIMICMLALMFDSIFRGHYHHKQLLELKRGWNEMVEMFKARQEIYETIIRKLQDAQKKEQ
jgi:hypothetical protein